MRTRFLRAVAAVATALVCLVASATPASADTITAGVLALRKTGEVDRFTPLPGGNGCATTFEMDVTATAASITAMALTRRTTWSGTPTVTYVAVITRTGGSTGTRASGNLTNIGLSLNVVMYTLATGTTCTIDTRVCEFDVDLTLSGTVSSGSFDTVNLNAPASSITVVPPCNAPVSDYIGGTLQVGTLFAIV